MDSKTRLIKDSGIELVNILNEAIQGNGSERDFLSRLLELYEFSLFHNSCPEERLRELLQLSKSKKVEEYEKTIFNVFAVVHRVIAVLTR